MNDNKPTINPFPLKPKKRGSTISISSNVRHITRIAFHKTQQVAPPVQYEQSQSLPFIPRNEHNSTHINNIDSLIISIIPFSFSTGKFILAIILYVLSLGFLFLLSKLFPSLYIKLHAVIAPSVSQADFLLIIDIDGHIEIIYPEKSASFFHNSNKKSIEDTPYIGNEKDSDEKHMIIFYYKQNKYFFNGNEIEPVMFSLAEKTLKEIHKEYGSGIQEKAVYDYLHSKFDKNFLKSSSSSLGWIFLKVFFTPVYIYQVIAIIIWFCEGFYVFSCITIVLVILTVFITAQQQYHSENNYAKLISEANAAKTAKESNVDIIRGDYSNDKDESSLVPGDVISIKPHITIPCDCLLLDGYCTMNESVITGESSIIMKSHIPFNDSKFGYLSHRASILLSGTKVEQCKAEHSNHNPKALVIATGFNTEQGNLIQNLLYPQPSNFKYYQQILYFVLVLFVLACGCIGLICLYYYGDDKDVIEAKKQGKIQGIAWIILDILTMIFPTAFPICLTINAFNFQRYLRMKNICCISEYSLNAAGRVNVIIFDKTGTLTYEGLELKGFQLAKMDNSGVIELDSIEKYGKVYNYVHLEFYKKRYKEMIEEYNNNQYACDSSEDDVTDSIKSNSFKSSIDYINNNDIGDDDSHSNNQGVEGDGEDKKTKNVFDSFKNLQHEADMREKHINQQLNLINFIECLATCHSIENFNGKRIGNSIDTIIFDSLKWKLFNTADEKSTSETSHIINNLNNISIDSEDNTINQPKEVTHYYYTIPKNTYKISEQDYFNLSRHRRGKQLDYKLLILKRFPFVSKFQSSSVIIRNTFDNSLRFFIKGAPEKIIVNCDRKTIPADFDKNLNDLTNKGYRLIACATKLLKEQLSIKEINEVKRDKYESSLTFLGFIVFENQLKKDSKAVIETLQKSGLRIIVSTGDNPYTSLSVAKECGIVNPDNNICIIESESLMRNNHLLQKDIIVNMINTKDKVEVKELISIPSLDEMIDVHNKTNESNESQSSADKDNEKSNNESAEQDGSHRHIKENEERSAIQLIKPKLITPAMVINKVSKYILSETNLSLCISGEGFVLLLALENTLGLMKDTEQEFCSDIIKELTILLNAIRSKAIIFYRMSPNDKVELINFIKEDKNNIVGMCGDGANDSGALLCADVGIALNGSDKSILFSHFISLSNCLKSVEYVIKNGRACLENTICICKFIIVYTTIQMACKLILFYHINDLTKNQYAILGCFIMLFCNGLVSRTKCDMRKEINVCPKNIFSLGLCFSLGGHLILQVCLFLGYYFLLVAFCGIEKEDNETMDALTYLNSYLYTIYYFQMIGLCFMIHHQSKCRKSIFSNRVFLIYYSWLLFIMIAFLAIREFEDWGFLWDILKYIPSRTLDLHSPMSRLITYGGIILSWLMSFLWEMLYHRLFSGEIHYNYITE